MRIVVLLLALGFLAGCSTNLSKGNNMMEAEQFDEAVRYYEKAMLDDPGDTEVATKLYEARTQMVMANLIKVRLQRQSNQHRAAAMQLNKSLHNIKRWKIIADSNVKATIDEEVLEGGVWLNKELKNIAKRKDHNTFFYTLKQFNYILDAGYADETISQYKPTLQIQGQQQCQNMKSQLTSQSYYLYDVWQAYCSVFAKQVSYKLAKDKTRYTKPSLNSRSLKIDKKSGITARDLAFQIAKGIESHPWFDSNSTSSMNLSMMGNVDYRLSVSPKTFSKTVMVYDEKLELIKDPKNPKQVIRKLINRKKVPKTTHFKGKEYTEEYAHSVRVSGSTSDKAINVLEQSARQVSKLPSHDAYFKDANVRPLKPSFKNKQAWQKQIAIGLITKLNQDLDQAWIAEFCSDQNIDKNLSKTEYAIRCAHMKPEHTLINAWTQSEFALSFQQLNVMLGR